MSSGLFGITLKVHRPGPRKMSLEPAENAGHHTSFLNQPEHGTAVNDKNRLISWTFPSSSRHFLTSTDLIC